MADVPGGGPRQGARARVLAVAAWLWLAWLGWLGCAAKHSLENPTAGGLTEAGSSGSGAPRERSLLVRATAYNSTRAQTDSAPHEAAFGDTLRPGMRAIAVSPDLLRAGIRPGMRVRIEGLPGEFRVLDKTASRSRRHVDIYMGNSISSARRWGSKRVRIYWTDEGGARSVAPRGAG